MATMSVSEKNITVNTDTLRKNGMVSKNLKTEEYKTCLEKLSIAMIVISGENIVGPEVMTNHLLRHQEKTKEVISEQNIARWESMTYPLSKH
jgi:hypothetical protein